MFDIGWTELLTIAVVAIVVVGPKDLPRVLRTVGQWTGRMKRMARDFQGQFNEAIREAELEGVKKDIEEIGKIDPMADLKKNVAEINEGLKIEDKPVAAVEAPSEPPAIEAKADTASGPAATETASPAETSTPAEPEKPVEFGPPVVPPKAAEPPKAEVEPMPEAEPATRPAPAAAAGEKP